MEDALIIAVIIMKQAPKIFQSKSKLNETRGVMNLSLRDSPNDVINCTIWGSEPFVTNYDRIFQIGNVGKQRNHLFDISIFFFIFIVIEIII